MGAHVEQDGTAKDVIDLARRFRALGRASGVAMAAARGHDPVEEFDGRITTAKTCSAPAIATFASGLDAFAVRAALTERWSNGQAEGQMVA